MDTNFRCISEFLSPLNHQLYSYFLHILALDYHIADFYYERIPHNSQGKVPILSISPSLHLRSLKRMVCMSFHLSIMYMVIIYQNFEKLWTEFDGRTFLALKDIVVIRAVIYIHISISIRECLTSLTKLIFIHVGIAFWQCGTSIQIKLCTRTIRCGYCHKCTSYDKKQIFWKQSALMKSYISP